MVSNEMYRGIQLWCTSSMQPTSRPSKEANFKRANKERNGSERRGKGENEE